MNSFGDGIMEGEQAAENPIPAGTHGTALANVPRGTMGDCVASVPADGDPELATYRRIILRSVSSGIDADVSGELRQRCDLWAVDMLRRGFGRDVRAAMAYQAKMRQLDIAAAKAITDAQRADQSLRRNQPQPRELKLSELRAIIEQARQAGPS